MPIYEYYCRDNNRIYQFFAKTVAHGKIVPKCPDNPKYRMEKMVSRFAVSKGGKGGEADLGSDPSASPDHGNAPEDARMDAAVDAMEREFSSVDENDSRAMGRMMRRMSELSGEKIEGEMEEMVRKLEEGADPDALEEKFGGAENEEGGGDPDGEGAGLPGGPGNKDAKREPRSRPRARRPAATRDPKLYDYD